MANMHMKKMLSITNCQGNAYLNQDDMKTEDNKSWQGCGKMESLCIAGWNVKQHSCYGKQHEVPQKLKHRITL